MKKERILGAAVLAVAIVGLALILLYSSLDSLVKTAIETYGSEILGTRVRVSSVELELSEGRGSIRGLRVANPPGFSSKDAFRLGEITLQIAPKSLTERPLVVPEVRIIAPEVRYEIGEGRMSNIDAILENVKAQPGGGGASASGSGERDEPPRIAIGSFVFEAGRVDADLEAVGGETVTAELPPVRLKNIGGRRGATPDEIGKEVMSAFLGSVIRSVARSQIERVIDEKLGGAGDSAKKLLQRMLD